ncbi:MAG: hypothetical protein ATN34_04400 [Epulopiscium sp. Nele67-Bin002]|nr:MAG: hypothetical protein ATN33_02845 [Epulopiscium sp. Nele67-Bin001]OON91143.1 MAG: hypothetical protein ATN34_04400 [Epulopiscium sp. Nele67-Bin002]
MRTKLLLVLPILAIIILSAYALNIGSIELTLEEMCQVVFSTSTENRQIEIVRLMRVPPIFVGIISGAMFAMSGVLLQAVMKNPLADPSIIGISGGASFGAMLATSLFPGVLIMEPLLALVFGLLGGCLLLFADVISRSIIYPVEIPLDVIMALIGAPFFLYMIKKGGTC